MMPDYIEALISQKGLSQVIEDLHTVVKDMADMAEGQNSYCLWRAELDLDIMYQDLKEHGW